MYFNTQLFHRGNSEVYQLLHLFSDVEEGQPRHTFGGKAHHQGTIAPGSGQRIHLFYELDLTDPLIEVRPPRPEITRLPLYYPLGNMGGMFEYQVLSERKIKILSEPYPEPARNVPKPYPKPFKQEGIELMPIGYDPTDPQWLWDYGGILGVGKLTRKEKATTRRRLERWHQETFDYPLIDRYHSCSWTEADDPDLDEIVTIFNLFTQGTPEVICPNPDCAGHKENKLVPPLAYLQPDEEGYEDKAERQINKLLAGGDSGQLIWMVCPLCMSVVVDNPCT